MVFFHNVLINDEGFLTKRSVSLEGPDDDNEDDDLDEESIALTCQAQAELDDEVLTVCSKQCCGLVSVSQPCQIKNPQILSKTKRLQGNNRLKNNS